MFSSAFLLFGLAVIFQDVPAVQSDIASDIRFETEQVQSEEIPYQIILQNLSSGKYFCGGVLVSLSYVLTAAQCVYRRNISEIIVRANTRRLWEDIHNDTARAVNKIIVHKQYDPQEPWRNDIALLRLKSSYSKEYVVLIEAVALPLKQGTRGDERELATVSGYGITPERQEPSFQRLMKQYTYVSPREYCQYVYSTIQYNISETQICANDPYNPYNSEHRVSDIGGPLVINEELAGIASSTSTHFPEGVIYPPMIFTSVSSYRNWIWGKMHKKADSDTHNK